MSGSVCEVRLLGPLTVSRKGVQQPLPASRKVRALLAFLAVAPAPVQRTRLMELLCDSSSDPRGELRWCLSRLRTVLDDARTSRVQTHADAISLDLSDCRVDAAQIARTQETGLERLDLDALRQLRQLFTGDFAAGLELDRSPRLAWWLSAQRRQFRANHVAVLRQIVARLGADQFVEKTDCLEAWLQLAPFDRAVHEMLLDTLLAQGRVKRAKLISQVRFACSRPRDSTVCRSVSTGSRRATAPVNVYAQLSAARDGHWPSLNSLRTFFDDTRRFLDE